ncbi:MAG: glycosyltransferase family 39 protein [Puia sp.]|nr:glycosyltransferase family 39 protein [Puia sp.]
MSLHNPGSFIRKHHKLLFFGAWLLINLVQAGGTELFDDEAYYWVYSRFPAWGYFDHPPMIAILIRAGYLLFHNEFGVRLLIVCAGTATLYFIGELTARKDDRLFYAMACAMAVLQIGGFMAVPDIPLLFFATLFFWVYRLFLRQTNLRHALLLGLVIALMLYSKYHGLLVIVFTFLSFPRLLLKYASWLAIGVAILLYFPHIYWQYQHGFPSIQFHLLGRNAAHYQASFTIEYIIGQLLMAGPFAGFILIGAALVYRPADRLEKALRYNLVGFYLFFLLSTLKGRVEANWTLPSLIGLMVLSHQYLVDRERLARWIYRLAPLTLMGVMIGRTYMMMDLPRSRSILKDEVHGNRQWVGVIRRQSGGLPVVFLDSYQLASKYWFYSGLPSFSLNSPYGRRNNFNFWSLEDSLTGKRVYVVGPIRNPVFTEKIDLPGWTKNKGKRVDRYFSFSRVSVGADGMVSVPAACLPLFQQPEFAPIRIEAAIFKEDSLVGFFPTGMVLKDLRKTRTPFPGYTPPALPAGAYQLRYSLSSCITGTPTVNSAGFTLIIP